MSFPKESLLGYLLQQWQKFGDCPITKKQLVFFLILPGSPTSATGPGDKAGTWVTYIRSTILHFLYLSCKRTKRGDKILYAEGFRKKGQTEKNGEENHVTRKKRKQPERRPSIRRRSGKRKRGLRKTSLPLRQGSENVRHVPPNTGKARPERRSRAPTPFLTALGTTGGNAKQIGQRGPRWTLHRRRQ